MLRQLRNPALENPIGHEIYHVNIVISRTMYRQSYVTCNYEEGARQKQQSAEDYADIHVTRLQYALSRVGFRNVIISPEIAPCSIGLYNADLLPGGAYTGAMVLSWIAAIDMIISQLIQQETGLITPFHTLLPKHTLDEMGQSALKGLADNDRSDISSQ
ncbi:MAG TPA: hypothetical protein VK147_11540 [Candidatus Didemnitutus sp.]|nr:hypothetical protein [Candidatus Didemnitutus sp.]